VVKIVCQGGLISIMESKVVFIGAGNMAEAIVSGMEANGFCAIEKIVMTDLRTDRLHEMEKKYSIETSAHNRVVENAEMVVLAVKPQVLAAVLKEIAPFLKEETLLISIAAGISCAKIEAALEGNPRVVRVMPNTPALVGQGAAAIAAGTFADQADMEVTKALLQCVGLTVCVEEKDLDAVTALSGSGPAYVFYLLEAMLAAAEEMGLEKKTARALALQTVEGAARLMKDSGESATALRERVTSKGGTTEAAIYTLNDENVKEAVLKALKAAHHRSVELSNG